MARKPMVTRTFTTTIALVLGVNPQNEETTKKEVILPREYKTDKDLNKAVKEIATAEDFIPVKVVNTTLKETLRGMSEEDFLKYSVELPPRTATEEATETPATV